MGTATFIQRGRAAAIRRPPASQSWAAFDSVLYTQLPSLAGPSNQDRLITHRHSFNMCNPYGINDTMAAGSHFLYNDLGVAAEVAAMKVIEGNVTQFTTPFNTYLGTTLQIDDHTPFLEPGVAGARLGAGFHASPHDFARILLLWMKRGDWSGTRVLAESFFTDVFEPVGVPNALPIRGGPDSVGNDYAGFGTFGGGVDQITNDYGPGLYGTGMWRNGTVRETGTRAWADAPLDLMAATGSGGSIILYVPSTKVIIAAVGTWGDITTAENTTFNTRMNLVNDMVTGEPDYAEEFPGVNWTLANGANDAARATSAGISDATLTSLVTAAGGRGIVVRHGRQVREWGYDGEPSGWASCSKPVLATMLACAIEAGKL